MTWKRLQALATVLLGDDTQFPEDEAEKLAVLEYALHEVAVRADALRLVTDSNDSQVLKVNLGGEFTRKPILPRDETEIIDIDNTLCFAVARFMAAILSFNPNMSEFHEKQAVKVINQYNTSIEAFKESLLGPDENTTREEFEYGLY